MDEDNDSHMVRKEMRVVQSSSGKLEWERGYSQSIRHFNYYDKGVVGFR